MFCNACGSEILLDAEVCQSCGRPVSMAVRSLARAGASGEASSGAWSGAWARPAEVSQPSAGPEPSTAATASIHAGDLDQPSFPRALPGRVALLTGVVMLADILLPWVRVNGEVYSPRYVGLPALALVATLAAVIVQQLIPRWRRARLTSVLPFGVGALTLGFASSLWLFTGPLAPMLTAAFINRIAYVGGPGQVFQNSGTGGVAAILQVTPSLGLYIFILGACVLLVAGYYVIAPRHDG